MDYGVSDSTGTDDDLPPSPQYRIPRGGQFAGIERSAVGSISFARKYTDMEAQIHHLEQEAYCAVLRAFKAQSDAITWEKEGLITELRKELRVSDDEHRELLGRVNSDDIISKIREWRTAGGHQAARFSASQPVYDLVPSPTVSASRKKQKTSQSQGQPFPGLSSMKSMQYPSTGPSLSRQLTSRSTTGPLAITEPAEAATYDLIGKKVWMRWPADNSFYEALITDYNPNDGRHALIYDKNTANETFEWVDFKEISREDIRWEGEELGLSHQGNHGSGHGRRVKKSTNHGGVGPVSGRGRGHIKPQSKKQLLPSQNGIGNKLPDDLELLNTDSLVKEVERVFNASNPDPFELEKARKMLKDHEQALVDAIERLAYASDGESDGEHGEHAFMHG
ncbi:protein EMSY-LIKE 1 isoform X2 [Rosa chinensis]|uniref:protein EMSY-LIKE 1 isoform X2 n=1 Tax=Rosa chinensis TaxID=74649 RepID=UPI000D0964A6|nr:protein EMSY-LIKE 1 isoform X2 [Rosa chinensis]